jgi:hypothetical protein
MPIVWQRHPRYFILVALVLTATIFLLNPYHPHSTDSYAAYIRDSTLPARIERAERVYQKVIVDRKELIRKYGPTPRDIVMYVSTTERFHRGAEQVTGSHQTKNRGQRTPFVSLVDEELRYPRGVHETSQGASFLHLTTVRTN